MIETFKDLKEEVEGVESDIDRFLISCNVNTGKLLAENAAPEEIRKLIEEYIVNIRTLFLTKRVDYWIYSSVTFFLLAAFGIADMLEAYDIKIFLANIEKMQQKGIISHDEQMKGVMIAKKVEEVIDDNGK